MSGRGWIGVCGTLGLLALAGGLPAPGSAAPPPITGTLSKPGYTVLAMAADGTTTSVRARSGRFRLRPPAARVTLHLRGPRGRYAGPVVIRRERRGTRAVVGVRAGARLGQSNVCVRAGHATVRRTPPSRWVAPEFWARARGAVPIGAGNFGRVRSRHPRAVVPGDRDLDAIPDLLDIDDDGDLVLDKLDRVGAATSSTPAAEAGTQRASVISDQFHLQSNLTLEITQTANANAASLGQADIDRALSSFGVLMMGILPGDSSELDCGQPQSRTDPGLGGLGYCSRGGTGTFFKPGAPFDRFPDAFDPDGDGFGTMTPSNPGPAPGSGQLAMFLRHGATTDRIGTGDLLIQRVTRGAVETQYPATVQYVFATVPALVSYDDGRGNATTVGYPVPGPTPGPAGPGHLENGFPVTAPGNSDVVVTLTFWRPQRRPIPPEQGDWTDIGGLNYSASMSGSGASCPQSAFSEASPVLRPLTNADVFPASYFGVKDLAPDRPASPANTFTYTLNLTRCLASSGLTFAPGETRSVSFRAHTPNGTDAAEQFVAFTRR